MLSTSFVHSSQLPDFYGRDVVRGTQCAGHAQQTILGQVVIAQTVVKELKTETILFIKKKQLK